MLPALNLPSQAFDVDLLSCEEGIALLQGEWDRLVNSTAFPNVFMTYDWFQAWNRRFASQEPPGHRHPYILALKQEGTVTGIVPLVRIVSSRFGITVRHLQFVGREWDYNDLVIGESSPEQIHSILEFLSANQRDWDFVDLRDVRPIGDVLSSVVPALQKLGLQFRILPEEERSPYMLITGTWQDTLARCSAKTRQTFRYRQSRSRKLYAGQLRIRIVEQPHEEPQLLQRMMAVEAKKRVGGVLSVPFLGQYPDVFARLFETLGPKGWFTIILMELGDRLIAWNLLFRCGAKLWGYVTAYDNEFSRLSPGTMLLPAIVDYSFSRGFHECDFLSGEEPYKMRWATGIREKYRIVIWNPRLPSRLRSALYFGVRRHERIVQPAWHDSAGDHCKS